MGQGGEALIPANTGPLGSESKSTGDVLTQGCVTKSSSLVASVGTVLLQHLEPEGLVRGKEERGVLKVHVGASGPGLTMAALEVHDFLGDAGRDGGREPALYCKTG